jgi:hypothetical protein
MEKKRYYNEGLYKDYDDWYDNGPGSEAFKRKLASGKAMPLPDLLSPRSQGPHFPAENESLQVKGTPIVVLKEEPYRSVDRGVNESNDMIRITINLPMKQWRTFKHKFIRLLNRVRLGGF